MSWISGCRTGLCLLLFSIIVIIVLLFMPITSTIWRLMWILLSDKLNQTIWYWHAGGACLLCHNFHKIKNYLVQAELTCISYLCFRESDDEESSSRVNMSYSCHFNRSHLSLSLRTTWLLSRWVWVILLVLQNKHCYNNFIVFNAELQTINLFT